MPQTSRIPAAVKARMPIYGEHLYFPTNDPEPFKGWPHIPPTKTLPTKAARRLARIEREWAKIQAAKEGGVTR